MQFLTSLFGDSGGTILTAVFALALVLVLILIAVWLLKLLFKASGNVGRGRNRRLSIVDSLPIDPKRQLLIIRRDDVEHLILTGGAQDIVVETGFAAPPVQQPRLPIRRPVPMQGVRPQAQGANNAAKPPVVAEPARPAAAPVVPPTTIPVEELRELGQPVGQRRSASLRHTGLMRPVSVMEPPVIPANTDNSAQASGDSVKKAQLSATDIDRGGDDDRQAAGGDGNYNKLSEDARKRD
jgi:flagellar protein FliO/FliZ